MADPVPAIHVFLCSLIARRGQPWAWPGHECVREDALSARWESVREPVAGSVIEGNCVAARRGGEQPEVNQQSVG